MASGSQLRVFLAGRVAVEASGHVIDETRFPGRQGRLLFAYLVAERGRAVPRDELAEALWQDAPPATWEKALTVIASKLRGLLTDSGIDGASALTGAFGCYRLELPEGTWVDVIAAVDAAAAAEDALVAGDLLKAKAEGSLATSLAEQPLLPGDDGTWVEEKRRELTQVRVRALTVLADACLYSGAPSEAATWAEQMTALEPFRETGYRRLMEAHVAAGNRAEALRVYERCRRLLAEELGAYPSPETESVYRSLLDTVPPEAPAAGAAHTPPALAGGAARRPRSRTRAALVPAALLVTAVSAAAFVLVSRGGHPAPRVLPNSVVRIDPATMKVTEVVPVADAPDLVVAAGGFVWVTTHVLRDVDSGALRNAGDRTLTRVDPSTHNAVVVGGGLAPCGLASDPSGDVWVANCYPGAAARDDVVRIDARTLHFEKTWSVPGGEGFYRGLAYGAGSLWVSEIVGGNYPNPSVVTQIDPQNGVKHAIPLARTASDLAWSEEYGDLWIDNFNDGSLTRLHAATGAVETVRSGARNPAFPIVDGDVVWVADWATPNVERIRAVGSARPQSVKLPVGNPTTGVWNVAAGAGAIWATTPRAGALWRINPTTNAVRRVRMPFLPTGVTTDAGNVWGTVRKS
jgi:DNA-binding SARP family transcriptional activator/sugar lactone lactonase YvrE